MDISSLDSKIANASATGGRRRDGGEEGFRGVMELMAHVSAQASSKTDEGPRQRASEPRSAERIADPVKDDRREPVEKNTATDETREDETRENRSETRTAAPTASATPGADPATAPQTANGSAANSGEAAAQVADGAGDAPPVPQSTRAPTQLGVPTDGAPASSAPQGTAETSATGPANVAPSPNGTVAQATTTPTPAASADATLPQTAQGAAAQAGQAQVAQASPAKASAGQPSAAQTGTVPPAANQTAPTVEPQAPQGQPAQDAAVRSATAPQPPAGTEPTVTSGQAAAEARNADGRNRTLPRDVKVTVDQASVIARAQGVSSAVLVQAHMAAADGTGKNGAAVAQAATTQASTLQQGTTLHVGGGQALFVGADAGNAHPGGAQGADAGQSGGQNGGGQNGGGQNAGGQAQAGNTFPFGAATIGQRGFGGDAARAQFQEILSTRTARAPLQGAGTTSSGSPSSLSFTAGPGGPQSTHTTAMASRAEATAQGRPGALPSTAVGQVAVKLANSAADGGGKLTIRLNPEELGKVDVKLEVSKDGTVHAKISAEKPETLDMLQRDARLLDKALQDAGLKTGQNSLEFDLRGGNGQPTDRQEQQVASAGTSGPNDGGEAGEQTASDTSTQASSGGVRADGSYDLVA